MDVRKIIELARGEKEVDLILKNGRLVNVFSGDIHLANVAVDEGRVIGMGDYKAKEEVDLEGKYLVPGFFDGHIHLESSMVTPAEFARAAVPLGTTTVIIDPHEIANVMGLDGIRYMLEASQRLPLDVYIMLPSCVPATHLETSGAKLTSYDLSLLLGNNRVLGLGEMMNFPGVILEDREVLDKIRAAKGKRIDGHAPGLKGKDLCAYIGAGIKSDHECITVKEAKEKLRLGMYIMVREGTAARNLEDLLPLINSDNSRKCFFVSDDRHPRDLLEEGHINSIIKKAVKLGLDPITAIQMATINTAEYFKLTDVGAIAPGYRADMVVLKDIENFEIEKVFKDGRLVAQNGQILPRKIKKTRVTIRSSMNVDWMGLQGFDIKAEGDKVLVMQIIPEQIVTRKLTVSPKIEKGKVVVDIDRDILKIAVVERHLASGNVGIGLVKGFGLRKGALASSVAHDSHNIVIVGAKDEDMMTAAIEVVRMRGGQVVVKDDDVIASLALPIAGLMNERTLEKVSDKTKKLNQAATALGCRLKEPFMSLSFTALPPVPELKLTDKGVVDVEKFQIVSLFVDSD
ncbi:adenine deaminase [Candidatus Aerophobetes bacterium]|uniref:Adenine deaminase n=1 Tax=Aerophobetes bacterium TaxID=2030807 RepID=A0A523S381_UNCAE|nr:MAG: adenine deaminase [Candidatus Aerophobetes bacterium]